MTDSIELRGIRAHGFHGVLPEEKRNGQCFVIDVLVGIDLSQAALRDDLHLTVDYGDLASRIVAEVEAGSADLIETLASRLCSLVLADVRVHDVTIKVHKPDAPISVPFDDVSVTMTRDQRPTLRLATIALGSNLGDRSATILAAVSEIARLPGVRLSAVSSLHETVAVRLSGPDESAPRYVNAVVQAETTLAPRALLDALHDIERRHGRTREEVWGDRTLDLDLIDMGGMEIDSPTLQLPHPRAAAREFVLGPWFEVDPGATLIGYGAIRDLLKASRHTAPPSP